MNKQSKDELQVSSTELLPTATTLASETPEALPALASSPTLPTLSGFSMQQTVNELKKNIEDLIIFAEENSVCIIKTDEDAELIADNIAYVFRDEGKDYFERMSLNYDNITPIKAKDMYTQSMSKNLDMINFGKIFQLVNDSNNNISYLPYIKDRIIKAGKVDNAYKIGNLDDIGNDAPSFSDKITGHVPEILQLIIDNAFSVNEADILVIGALTAISGCLHQVYTIYDGTITYPNLFFFITAPASAGKGKLALSIRIVGKIDNELKSFEDRTLLFSSDSSATAFCQALKDNDGWGLLFDTEGDTLTNSFGKEYSDFSTQFRKAFHNESISLRRVGSGYLIVDEPKISALLTGTPVQIKNLFHSTENGLFSRFSFRILHADVVWKNVHKSRTQDLNQLYDSLGERFYSLYKAIEHGEQLLVILTDAQKRIFNIVFEKLQYESIKKYGANISGTVRRLALTVHRIAVILTVLRIEEDGNITSPLTCCDEDFETSMTIGLAILEHDIEVFVKLFPNEQKANKYNKLLQDFYNKLPDTEFTRQDFVNVANELKIPVDTAQKYIKKFKDNNDLTNTKYGYYIKTFEYDNAA